MQDNGKMIDAVCNMPGEIKTCFKAADDIRYGFKDQDHMAFCVINKEEEI